MLFAIHITPAGTLRPRFHDALLITRELQVSFVRDNLTFRVVNKDNVKDEEGQSVAKWRLIDYIKYAPHASMKYWR